MTNEMDNFPYWSEEYTMNFLGYSETSMRTLRKSKAITRYEIGHRYFYDKQEIIKLIEDSKVYAQDINEYQQYIQNVNKGFSDAKLNGFERRFVLNYAKYFLDSIHTLIPETNRLNRRDRFVLDSCLSNMNFKDVAEKCNLTPTRIGHIFHKSLRITTRVCSDMKKNYEKFEKSYISLQEEIKLLKKQNYELKAQLFDLNKDSQLLSENTDSILYTSVFDLDASVRLMNVLRANDCKTLGDVVRHERRDFLRFRNFGSKSLSELIDILEKYDLKLKR